MKKQVVKLIIFDLDGTLIDAYKAVDESVNYVMKELGLPRVSKQQIVRSVGWGEMHLLRRFIPPEKMKKATWLYRRHHPTSLIKSSRLLPGAKRLLDHLRKRGYLLAVASNRATRFSRLVTRNLEILEYFDCVLCRDKVRRPKPYPDILRGILKKLKVEPARAVYVGDMTIDVQAGRRARVKTIAVPTGSSTRGEIKRLKPYRIVKCVYEVASVLDQIHKN